MADSQQNILINFEVNNQDLVKTVELLEQTGQISKQAADAIRSNFDRTATTLTENKGDVDTLNKSLQDLYKVSAKDVQLGIADALAEAGVEAKDFENALKGANKEQQNTQKQALSSKAQLKAMREEMIQLSLAGKQNTERFKELEKASGHLADTIDDVGKTIKRVGSDTHVLDGLINAAQGLAGGFAVAQGAAALFGDENKELQETLLKVNAAMAILQGLQQIQNVLQKESAASLLLMRDATVAETAATEGASLATKAWNAVLALNPIVLVVALVASLAKVVYDYATNASDAAIQTDQLNKAIERTATAADRVIKANENESALKIAQLKRQGAEQTKVADEELKLLERNQAALQDQRDELSRQLNESNFADEESRKKVNDQIIKLDEQLSDGRFQIAIKTNENIAAAQSAADADEKKRREEKKKQDEADLKARIEFLKDQIDKLKTAQLDFSPETDSFRQLQVKINDTELAIKKLTDRTAAYNLAAKETAQANDKLFSTAVQRVDETRKSADELFQESADKAAASIKAGAKRVGEEFKQVDPITNKESAAERRKKIAEETQLIAGYLSQSAELLGSFFEQESQRQIDSIDRQKDKVKELQASGEITAKEAEVRTKRLDQAEKQVQLQAAKRQKAIAIFEAVTNTAAAVTKALASSPPPLNAILAAVVGALGAAQIALIASRPLPKFAKGKRPGMYEGFGIIGEAGAELHVTREGAMVARGPIVTYLKKEDTVFNAAETARILADKPRLTRQHQLYRGRANNPGLGIDYRRFGKEVGAHVHNTAVNITEKGIERIAGKGNDFTRYLTARRGL